MAQYSLNVRRGFDEIRDAIDDALHDPSGPFTNLFDNLERRTNTDRVKIFFGGVIFCALYLIFGCGAQLLCNIIGIAYPAFQSLRDVEWSSKQDDTKWMIYWVTFALLTVIEYFSTALARVIPLYWLLKCSFLVWCMMPIERNGSDVIYYRVVRPYVLKKRTSVLFPHNSLLKTN